MFYEGEAGLGLPGQPLSPRLCQGLRPLGWDKYLLCLTPVPEGFASLERSQVHFCTTCLAPKGGH